MSNPAESPAPWYGGPASARTTSEGDAVRTQPAGNDLGGGLVVRLVDPDGRHGPISRGGTDRVSALYGC